MNKPKNMRGPSRPRRGYVTVDPNDPPISVGIAVVSFEPHPSFIQIHPLPAAPEEET